MIAFMILVGKGEPEVVRVVGGQQDVRLQKREVRFHVIRAP